MVEKSLALFPSASAGVLKYGLDPAALGFIPAFRTFSKRWVEFCGPDRSGYPAGPGISDPEKAYGSQGRGVKA